MVSPKGESESAAAGACWPLPPSSGPRMLSFISHPEGQLSLTLVLALNLSFLGLLVFKVQPRYHFLSVPPPSRPGSPISPQYLHVPWASPLLSCKVRFKPSLITPRYLSSSEKVVQIPNHIISLLAWIFSNSKVKRLGHA